VASEQPHHRQVERAATAVGSGVDEPTDTMPIDQPVAGPQVAESLSRHFVGRRSD
jgi:hypothetical protein